jgi:hypothetical protein
MIPIAHLVEQHRGLVKELARYEYASVAPLLGGFLTLPGYHANTLRLDALAQLACLGCAGRRKADREMLVKCAGEHFVGSELIKFEDPVEDAFIGNIATAFGNFRVFRGIEEAGDFWAERLLRPLEESDCPEPLIHIVRHVSALLTLSDAIAERLSLKRYSSGSGELRRRLVIPQWRHLAAAAQAVTFSPPDLERLKITQESLAPFIFTDASRNLLPNQTTGHSDFERFPIAKFGNQLVMAAPHTITLSIRRFVVEQLEKSGFLGFYDMILHSRQVEDWLDTLRRDFDFTPFSTALPEVPKDFPAIYQTVAAFDEGKYAHLVLLDGNISGHLENAHDMDQVSEDQQRAFERHLIACSEKLKRLPNYNGGMTVITRGGIGRGILMGYKDVPKDWEFIFAALPDWYTLAGCEDMSALRMWRMCRQQSWAEQRGLEIHNINGPLNLYACWRANGWRFLLREMPLANPRKMLGMEIDFLTNVRKEVDQARDEHSCPSHDGATWVRIRRRYPKSDRDRFRNTPMYVAPNAMRDGQLLGVIESPLRIWWIAAKKPLSKRESSSVVFELWDCLLNWLGRGVAVIERAVGNLPKNSIWIEIEFTDIEKWEIADAECLGDQATAFPSTAVDVTGRQIIITIPAGFRNEFHFPDNRAERGLMSKLVQGICELAATTLSQSDLASLMTSIFRNAEARFFHVVRTDRFVQMLGEPGRPSPDFITEEDLAQSLIGLTEEVGGVPSNGTVQGQTECLVYLEKVTNTLWERIEKQLNAFNRREVITCCLAASAELQKDEEHWNMTSRALLSLEENDKAILEEADERRAKREAASLTSRLIVETAMYASPLAGGGPLPRAERLELMAHMQNLVSVANHRDAISGGFMRPVIHIFPNGELDVDDRFYASTMLPYSQAYFTKKFRSAAKNYERWFTDYKAPVSPESEKLLSRLEQPFFEEFGITLDQFTMIVGHLRKLALERQNLLLEFDEPSFLQFLEREIGIGEDGGRRYLDRFSLPPRRAWDKDLPRGCAANDVWPWRFRRQLSLVMRPLILISNNPDKRWLVYPHMMERSHAYLLHGLTQSAFPTEHFQSRAMLEFCGERANRQGNRFTHDVADRLEQLGFKTLRETGMSALGVPTSLGDFGDVDVVAWKVGSHVAFIIECKHLRTAASVRDVVDRLDEYRGERDDSLAKHLRRLDWLKSSPSHLCALTGIPTNAIQLRGRLVTDSLVPMQFFNGSAISPNDVISFEQLASVFK